MRVGIVLLVAAALRAQDDRQEFVDQEIRAFGHFEREDWAEAEKAFEKQIALFPASPRPYYNLACCYALQGDADRAAVWLRLAIHHGWRDAAHVDADTDFDGVRGAASFRAARATLDRVPPLAPQRISPDEVPSAPTLPRLLAEEYLAFAALDLDERVWLPEQIRARLFAYYDRRIARLARFLRENGDAGEGHEAAYRLIETARAYGSGAEPGSRLARVAAAEVERACEEFFRRWPTSPHRFEVRRLRAELEPGVDALLAVERDADHGPAHARTIASILLRDPSTAATLYPRFLLLYRDDEVGKEMLEGPLWRVRLEQDGLPDGLEFEPALENPRRGRLVIGVVQPGDEEAAARYGDQRLALVVVGPGTWTGVEAPRAKHPVEAARRLAVPAAPLFLVFEDGKLVAVNSSNSED